MREEDQRKHARKPLFCRAAIMRDGHVKPIPARVTEISIAGVGLLAGTQLFDGAPCSVVLELPPAIGTPRYLTLNCAVVYSVLTNSAEFRVGLKFVVIADDTLTTLRKIVDGVGRR